MNRIDTVSASRVLLYPPRVTPPPKPLNLPQAFIRFLSNPLLTIPEAVYHEPLVVLHGPPAITWVTDPALVKIVLLDRCDNFPQDPLLRRVLGPLFGNGILTSEGRDWRWQHQTVAPLFRYGEVLRYVPAMVAGAEAAIKAWSAVPPGSTHAIDTDMVRATYHVISTRCWPATVPSSALPTMWRVCPGQWPMRCSTCLSGCRVRGAAECTFGSPISGLPLPA